MSALSAAGIALFPAITHPWGLVIVQLSVFGAAAFTQPTSSLRYAAIAVMAAIAGSFHLTVHDRMDNRLWKALPSGTAVGVTLTAIEKLLISRWSYEVGGPEAYCKNEINGSAVPQKPGFRFPSQLAKSKLWFVLDMLFSPRSVGRPWQVKNVPPFSSTDSSYVPSRRSFLLRTFALTILCYLIHDLCSAQPPPEARLIATNQQQFIGRLADITPEEMVFRTTCSIGFWISAVAYLNVFTNAFAFVAIASGVSEPAAWPSSFNSPTTAYSVRQFWGVFWHQNLRAMVEGISRFLTHSVLHLPKSTIPARYSNIFLSFFLSGLLHIGSDYGETVPVHDSGAMRFFLTQAFGIMLEDAFQAAYYSMSGKRRPAEAPLRHKVVGYVWLAIFLIWSTPVWSYPQIRVIRHGVDVMFPFTVFGHDMTK